MECLNGGTCVQDGRGGELCRCAGGFVGEFNLTLFTEMDFERFFGNLNIFNTLTIATKVIFENITAV